MSFDTSIRGGTMHNNPVSHGDVARRDDFRIRSEAGSCILRHQPVWHSHSFAITLQRPDHAEIVVP
jgi:hypothetical protein